MSGAAGVVEHRERELALSTERMIGWFRIIGGLVGVVLTLTDQVVHPDLEHDLEVFSLLGLAALGAWTLVWTRRADPDLATLRRVMFATYLVDCVVLLAQAPLHAFVALEAPSPALLVPLLGAVRFGYPAAVVGTIGVAAAYWLRGVIAVDVYGQPFGVDPMAVTVLIAGIIGFITAHMLRSASSAREAADAATMASNRAADRAIDATMQAEAMHRVLADGVGGGVGPVVHRLAETVRDIVEADAVEVVIAGDGTGLVGAVRGGAGDIPEGMDAPTVDEVAVRYGPTVLGTLRVFGQRDEKQDVQKIAGQVGVAIHAARLLDQEASYATRYRALDLMRSNFVTLASHELRTPVTAVIGAAETLLVHGDQLGPDRTKELLDLVLRHGERLARLTDDLLTVGRSDAGELGYEPAYVRVRTLADLTASTVQQDLDLDGDPEMVVWVDPDRGAQVLRNLVENAMRYGVAPVEVRWRVEGRAARIEVVDRGPGIPAAERERVFERFVQLEPMRHHSRGSGLGLSVSRDVTRAMGGDVRIDVDAPTTTFVLELPLHPSGGPVA